MTNATTTQKMILENDFTCIAYDIERKQVSGRCKKDQNNLPSCYNQTTQKIKQAWAALQAKWTPETTMYGACKILSLNGLRMHTYCAMD